MQNCYRKKKKRQKALASYAYREDSEICYELRATTVNDIGQIPLSWRVNKSFTTCSFKTTAKTKTNTKKQYPPPKKKKKEKEKKRRP